MSKQKIGRAVHRGAWRIAIVAIAALEGGCSQTETEKKVDAVDTSAAELKQAIEKHTEAATEKIEAEAEDAKTSIRQVAGDEMKSAEIAAQEAEVAAGKAEAAAQKARQAAEDLRKTARDLKPDR